jgi:hypothetical protein
VTDHAALARDLLHDGKPTVGQGYTSLHETQVVMQLAGIGHALLAVAEALRGKPAVPAGMVDVSTAAGTPEYLPAEIACSTCGHIPQAHAASGRACTAPDCSCLEFLP